LVHVLRNTHGHKALSSEIYAFPHSAIKKSNSVKEHHAKRERIEHLHWSNKALEAAIVECKKDY
jgi:hypothetical protein